MPVKKLSPPKTPSIIAGDVNIHGNVDNAGELQLDGTIIGNLSCTSLVMGEYGQIVGMIDAQDVVIRGRVEGEIRAKTVRLEATAVVNGDVFHDSLAVEAGAKIMGRFAHLSSVNDDLDGPVDFGRDANPAAGPDLLSASSAAE